MQAAPWHFLASIWSSCGLVGSLLKLPGDVLGPLELSWGPLGTICGHTFCQESAFSLVLQWFRESYFFYRMRSRAAFWPELGSIWAPTRPQKGGLKGPKTRPKRRQNDANWCIDFRIHFGSILGAPGGGYWKGLANCHAPRAPEPYMRKNQKWKLPNNGLPEFLVEARLIF